MVRPQSSTPPHTRRDFSHLWAKVRAIRLPTFSDIFLSLLVLVTALQVTASFLTLQQSRLHQALAIICAVATLWRSRRPYIVVGIIVICILVHTIAIPTTSFLVIVTSLIAIWTAAGRFDPPWRWPVVIAGYILTTAGLTLMILRHVVTHTESLRLYGWLWLVTTVVVLAADRRRANRSRLEAARERLALLESQQETMTELAVIRERARLAREIHDLLGHTLTVVTMQAEGARYILHSSPERADQALATIAQISREGVDQVHELVDLLGQGSGEHQVAAAGNAHRPHSAATSPQQNPPPSSSLLFPTHEPFDSALTNLAHLYDAKVSIDGTGPLPEGDIAEGMLLVAREALTNAVRHGRQGHMTIEYRATPTSWQMHIHNPIAEQPLAAQEGDTRPGVGIASMRKRVEDLGGVFSADRRENHWHVNVEVPR